MHGAPKSSVFALIVMTMAARAALSVSMISVTPAATKIMVAVAMTVATCGATNDFAGHLAALVVADLCLHNHFARHISDRQRESGADETCSATCSEPFRSPTPTTTQTLNHESLLSRPVSICTWREMRSRATSNSRYRGELTPGVRYHDLRPNVHRGARPNACDSRDA